MLTLGTVAATLALAPAAPAAAPPASLRLLAPLSEPITSYAYRGRVPLDFGVLVSAINEDVELRVTRPDNESPLVAWQSDPAKADYIDAIGAVLRNPAEDVFGRALGYVWLSGGEFANEMIVERGDARVFISPPNTAYADRFRAAAVRAAISRQGLWSGCPAG